MTDKAISPLRRRLLDDMAIRRLSPKTQHQYLRHVKRFADFLGRSADKATPEDVHRYQLWLASIGTTVPTVNVSATALRFFFKVTLRRHDLAEEIVSACEPQRSYRSSSPILIATGWSSGSNRARERRTGMSFSRPSFLSCCATGGGSRARRDGCLPVSPGCFPATAGSIPVRASSTGSFAWQRGAPALPNASAFIHCGTALLRISWSRRPISGSSRSYLDTRSSTRRRSIPASPSARLAR